MKPNVVGMHGVVWLGVGCLGLLSPLPAQEPKLRETLHGHTEVIFCVAFSPDGKTLASASQDKTIKLWDVATGMEKATLQGHSGTVGAVAFSPDGKKQSSAQASQLRAAGNSRKAPA